MEILVIIFGSYANSCQFKSVTVSSLSGLKSNEKILEVKHSDELFGLYNLSLPTNIWYEDGEFLWDEVACAAGYRVDLKEDIGDYQEILYNASIVNEVQNEFNRNY